MPYELLISHISLSPQHKPNCILPSLPPLNPSSSLPLRNLYLLPQKHLVCSICFGTRRVIKIQKLTNFRKNWLRFSAISCKWYGWGVTQNIKINLFELHSVPSIIITSSHPSSNKLKR